MCDCQDCKTAEAVPGWDGYSIGCASCEARALSRTAWFTQTMAAGKWTPAYRSILAALCGPNDDAARAMHQAAEEWAQRRDFCGWVQA